MEKNKLFSVFKLQLLVFVYSLISVLTKLTAMQFSEHGLFSAGTLAGIAGIGMSLLIYAFFWQKVLKKVNLTTAYANKAVGLLWTLVWAAVLFKVPVSFRNVAGLLVICAGVFLVMKDE